MSDVFIKCWGEKLSLNSHNNGFSLNFDFQPFTIFTDLPYLFSITTSSRYSIKKQMLVQ